MIDIKIFFSCYTFLGGEIKPSSKYIRSTTNRKIHSVNFSRIILFNFTYYNIIVIDFNPRNAIYFEFVAIKPIILIFILNQYITHAYIKFPIAFHYFSFNCLYYFILV